MQSVSVAGKMATGGESQPTIGDLQDDHHFVRVAKDNWLETSSKRVRPDVLKRDIWDVLEKERFPFRSLLVLENLQMLERYLWPTYNDDASNFQVLLIVLIINVKAREKVPTWERLSNRPEAFSSLFHRILSMALDSDMPSVLRSNLVFFILSAFQSLEVDLVRKQCVPLVSIGIWHRLSDERRKMAKIDSHPHLKKAWRAAAKRYDAADEPAKAKLKFDRSWLYSMILDFLDRLYQPDAANSENVLYCERFLEFLTDLESQLPTRRYVNALLQDLNLLPAIRVSPLFGEDQNELLRDLFGLLRHFVHFSVDDHTGAQLSRTEWNEAHHGRLARLQQTALKHFKSKLTILALSNYASIDRRDDLQSHLTELTDDEIVQLCKHLGFRTEYPKTTKLVRDRAFFTEVLLAWHEKRKNFQESVSELSISPTEDALFEPTLMRNETYNGSRPLAIPKLNLQYLTVGDCLWRAFVLHRCEAFFEIRTHVESVIARLRPQAGYDGSATRFDGFSKMALPIARPAILEVAPPKVGDNKPAYVRAEICLDINRVGEHVKREWEALRPDDVVFLLAVKPAATNPTRAGQRHVRSSAEGLGVVHLRTAEISQLCDENGRPLREAPARAVNGYPRSGGGRLRKLIVHLDPVAYRKDSERATRGKPDVYESINLIIRRRGRENNFKPILNSLRSLVLSDAPMPSWLEEVFLGYGDPASANYTRLPNRITTIDFRDTFLNWDHLVESLADKRVERAADSTPGPLTRLEYIDAGSNPETERPVKKRRREKPASIQTQQDVVKAQTYDVGSTGPYPMDAPRLNQIRFTPKQVEAIASGSQPGLTVIVGPPGTGKTDVATQIINNIYHNFPQQRTLLVAHSNQALNQLFQKIINLDIDARHLLRLGHGEEDLESEGSYNKYGRVESFLQNRSLYLQEVDRLADSLDAPGAHGNSCETAAYFDTVYVKPAWQRYEERLQSPDSSVEQLIEAFPFTEYFANAPQPLLPPDAPGEKIKDMVLGCNRHIRKIFAELEDIRPFEILRGARDKANYLLIKEARIIAMTSTHAAMRRQDIAGLGFKYDNVVMEEAAQIAEMETFMPLALQTPKDGKLPLQRIVLCGDHLQNSPIVQNLAFRQYANLEQSMFLRLIRLGVPTVTLDQQGRARPSIASLYKWRYAELGNLPNVQAGEGFKRANAGFRFEYQFVDVQDYKGKGETEPTPHFIQNLGEAEYAVAIYQYMRLIGYPASSISILTTYAGQRALIRDVLAHRCAKNVFFGLPRLVTTVDKYQGEQNDYIILSMTRTSRIGYLRDIRRMTVALSRARLGLYILGRRSVFESCYDLRDAIQPLFQRSDKLELAVGELHPADRLLGDEPATGTPMEGVEHLGQYVYEMTQAKIKAVAAAANGPLTSTEGAVGTVGTAALPSVDASAGAVPPREVSTDRDDGEETPAKDGGEEDDVEEEDEEEEEEVEKAEVGDTD